jgi:hypothetical protein
MPSVIWRFVHIDNKPCQKRRYFYDAFSRIWRQNLAPEIVHQKVFEASGFARKVSIRW